MNLISAPTAEQQVAFLGNIERLLSEGQFVATFKYALLLAIANLAVKRGADDGRELDLPIRDIAEEFIELYWRQGVPYGSAVGDGDYGVLLQNASQQAAILSIVGVLRKSHGTLTLARQSEAWTSAIAEAARLIRSVWLISFMHYDLGFFDDQCSRVECAPNPFTARVSPMPPE